jgi:hypothetical protein
VVEKTSAFAEFNHLVCGATVRAWIDAGAELFVQKVTT